MLFSLCAMVVLRVRLLGQVPLNQRHVAALRCTGSRLHCCCVLCSKCIVAFVCVCMSVPNIVANDLLWLAMRLWSSVVEVVMFLAMMSSEFSFWICLFVCLFVCKCVCVSTLLQLYYKRVSFAIAWLWAGIRVGLARLWCGGCGEVQQMYFSHCRRVDTHWWRPNIPRI